MAAFQREIQVRFGACDPATFVYYPRYFEMINGFVEDWFEDGLEASFPGLLYHKGILAPTVHFTIDFPRPSRFGDRLTFNLEVLKIGRTSCTLKIRASCQGENRVVATQVLVFMEQSKRGAVAIPTDVAKRMRHFIETSAAPVLAVAPRASKPRPASKSLPASKPRRALKRRTSASE